MPTIIETTELISKTMDNLIDYIVVNEFLAKQFENYLIKNKIEINKESELNDVLIDYILEGRIEDGTRVLDYFLQNSKEADERTINALKKSFVSVFRINKISKNSYETICISSNTNYSLIPLVKTTSLRGIGLYDYIKARVFELDSNFYLLEIFDCISQYKEFFANLEAVKAIVRNPKIATINSTKNFLELKKTNESFNSSFVECFSGDEIVVLNKNADKLLNDFYAFHKGEIETLDYEKIDKDFEFEYFEIENLNDDFMMSAITGFDESKKPYDVGFYSDSQFGLFLIPFVGTLNKILENNSLNEADIECIKYFLVNSNVSSNFLIKKANQYPNFVELINKAIGSEFNNIDEVIDFYKSEYKDGFRFSSVNVLYKSEVFSKVLGHKEEKIEKAVGRNDLCPCGSGKKYKKCCLLKKGVENADENILIS